MCRDSADLYIGLANRCQHWDCEEMAWISPTSAPGSVSRRRQQSNEEGKKMNRIERLFKRLMSITPLLLATLLAGCGGGDDRIGASASTAAGTGTGAGGTGRGPAPVNLRSAGNFVILAQSCLLYT